MTTHFAPPHFLTIEEWRKQGGPNYTKIFGWRDAELEAMLKDPGIVRQANEYYRTHPVEFITQWLDTHDPRNAYGSPLPKDLPFVLFERQAQFIQFLQGLLDDQQNGLVGYAHRSTTSSPWARSNASVCSARPGSL